MAFQRQPSTIQLQRQPSTIQLYSSPSQLKPPRFIQSVSIQTSSTIYSGPTQCLSYIRVKPKRKEHHLLSISQRDIEEDSEPVWIRCREPCVITKNVASDGYLFCAYHFQHPASVFPVVWCPKQQSYPIIPKLVLLKYENVEREISSENVLDISVLPVNLAMSVAKKTTSPFHITITDDIKRPQCWGLVPHEEDIPVDRLKNAPKSWNQSECTGSCTRCTMYRSFSLRQCDEFAVISTRHGPVCENCYTLLSEDAVENVDIPLTIVFDKGSHQNYN